MIRRASGSRSSRTFNRVRICARIALLFSPAPLVAGADLVLTNGNIYTLDAKQPHAEAVVVRQNKIAFVGSNAEAAKFADGARVIDLRGRTVVPGLTDSHCHLSGVGEREMTLNLEGTTSLEDFLAKVKARVAQSS